MGVDAKFITLWEAFFTVLHFSMLLTHAYAQDKRWPYVSLPLKRGERPEDWVPAETGKSIRDMYSKLIEIDPDRSRDIVDIFSIHSGNAEQSREDSAAQEVDLPSIWEQQFINALTTVREAKLKTIRQ